METRKKLNHSGSLEIGKKIYKLQCVKCHAIMSVLGRDFSSIAYECPKCKGTATKSPREMGF